MSEFLNKAKEIFIHFSWTDAIDILIVGALLYCLFYLLKKQNAQGVIKYLLIGLLVSLGIVVFSDKLPVSGRIITVIGLSFIILVFILFGTEIRRIMWKLSGTKDKDLVAFSSKYDCSEEDLRAAVAEIVKALQNMSKRNTGALLVFPHNEMPSQVIESGIRLSSIISSELLESIFITKGPLHDGAVVISGNKILAAGCFLPLSQDLNLPKELGTRHRAAIGASESFNVTSIMVSEETGIISVARHGQLSRYYDSVMLSEVLEQVFGLKANSNGKKRRR